MDALFGEGFSVQCETRRDAPTAYNLIEGQAAITPRLSLENLEKLAAAIHDLYNQKQLERDPDQPLAHPDFADLPDALKYSNLRQARSIAKKLDLMGWEMRPAGSEGEVIAEIPDQVVETLAVIEHEDWMRERLGYGWMYGEVKDEENRLSPYLVPYQQLSEEIKELDRDAVRNIPALLGMIDMAIYVKDQEGASPPNQPFLARRLPGSYID
jgi:hypothetical protein